MKIQFSQPELRYLRIRGMFDNTENARSWNKSGASIGTFAKTARKINKNFADVEEVMHIGAELPGGFQPNSQEL